MRASRAGAGGGLDLIDVGGGFPVAYDGLTPPPLADYMAEITAGLADLPLRPDAAICAEPGRALSAPGAASWFACSAGGDANCS